MNSYDTADNLKYGLVLKYDTKLKSHNVTNASALAKSVGLFTSTVIPRLTSDPAKEFFG